MASLMNYQAPSEAQPPQQPTERGSAPSKATTMATAAQREEKAPGSSQEETDDVRKYGYLKKQKHGHKRFFVLREQSHIGPARLEYYDNEKKFRNSLRSAHPSPPKKLIPLWQCFTVSRRADAKHKYLIALYTKDEYFAVVAENEQEQESWYQALSELLSESKREFEADELQEGDGALKPGTVFREVWQVNLKPKGLGSIKGLSGIYRLCLSSRMVHLIRPNSDVPTIYMLLMNIRRCGHSENYFFMDVGRSCNVGSGELWLQVDDSVVAQSVHEGFLETMRLYRASFAELRPRSKSQSSGVISFITTRRHLGNLPPSQTGLHRRSRTESVAGTPPTAKSSAYRFRTSSEGEGTMIKPFRSVTGSLLHLNTARMNLGRQEGTGRYVRAPFNSCHHTRSASLPVSHFPSATSPVSVCSSSGHGSASDTITRPSSSSVCGSPSDGGFISSDEYGSSPGDLRYFRVRSNTPDSLGNTPPIREESALSEYMTMDKSQSDQAGRDDNMEADKSHRKRTHSLTKPTITMVHQRTQTTSSLDEDSTENPGQILSSESAKLKSSPDCNDAEFDSMCNQSGNKSRDGGYMPMMPGVASSLTNSNAYLPMTPKSTCAPKQILNSWSPADTKGYMLMFPNAGSSPVKSQLTGFLSKSSEKVMNGEYMDMAHGNSAAQKQSADSNCVHTNSFAKSFSSYFSLPRSFKSASKKNSDHNEYIPMSSPGKFLHKGVENGLTNGTSKSSDNKLEQNIKATRPTRLPLDIKGSSIPGMFDHTIPPEPTSPGEYINIDFSEKANNTPYSLSAEGSPSSLGSSCGHRQSPLSDYMSVDLDLQSPKTELPSSLTDLSIYAGSSISRNQPNSDYARLPCGTGTVSSRNDDYTQMTFNMAMTPPRSFNTESSHGPVVDSPPSIVNRLCIGDRYLSNNSCSAEPPVGPKVIRADPQGRRRHSSETFSSSGTITTSSSIFTESSKRHSSASFDNVWPKPDESTCDNQEEGRMARNFAPGLRNGLNYISLNVHDTAKLESNCLPLQNATMGLDSGTYVSLDFPCSDGLECTSTRKE